MTFYVLASFKGSLMQDILERAKDIKLLIFDVDGVLTDGSIIIGDDGE